MTIINQHRIGDLGYLEEHHSVIKGVFRFTCNCERQLTVKIRRQKREKALFELEVIHGSRERTFTTPDLNELHVFDRMLSVQKYARCKLPLIEGWAV